MNCPRCGQKNQDNDKVCSNCSLKLKIACPKCKTLNMIGQENCTGCELKLISICPQCKAPNHPRAQNCRKCDCQLLVECPKCKFLNQTSEMECVKCGNRYNSIEEDYQESTDDNDSSLQYYAVLVIELINLASIKSRASQSLIELLKKFQQIIYTEARKKSEKQVRVNEQVYAIEFKKAKTVRFSSANAVAVAQRILAEVNDLNYKMRNEIDVKLKVKIGITCVSDQNNHEFCKVERTIASANDIVVSALLYSQISDMFDFEEMKSLPGNITAILYKFKDTGGIEIDLDKLDQDHVNKNSDQNKAEQEKKNLKKRQNDILQARDKLKKLGQLSRSLEEKTVSQEGAYNEIVDIITRQKKGYIVGISGENGAGRSTVISSIRQSLSNDKFVWLMGLCQPVNQIIPFAFIQDILRVIFNLPQLTFNVTEAKKIVSQYLEVMGIKNRQVENTIYKLMFQEYPDSDIAGIDQNKKDVFESIKTIFATLNAKSGIILVIDDLEFIDIASLDCIKYLINTTAFLNQGNHIISTHSSSVNLEDYLLSSESSDRLIKLNLTPMSTDEMNKAMLGMLNNQEIIPAKLKEKILTKAKGFPLYLEQALWLLFQTKTIYSEDNGLKFNIQSENMDFVDNIEDLIKNRLAQMNSLSPDIFRVMLAASLFGQRFMPALVQSMLGIERQQFTNLMQILLSNGIFVNFDNHSVIFKHKIIWEIIYNQWLSDEQKIDYHNQALGVLRNYTKANSSIFAIHAELSNHPDMAAEYWSQSAIEAISAGDAQAYTIAQKQILSLMDIVSLPDGTDKETLSTYIFEQLGRVNFEINPQEAIEYLSNAIMAREKNQEVAQVIELTGLLAKSCELTGNYNGIVECVDKALSGIDRPNMPVEYSLLCYSKLDALCNLGKLEEAVVIARSSVLPTIREILSVNGNIPGFSSQDITFITLDAELILAKILAIQGNKECIDITTSVIPRAKELGYLDIEVQAKLIEALYRALQGRVKTAGATLLQLSDVLPQMEKNNQVKLYWGIVNVISNIFSDNYVQAGKICYPLLILAEECGEYCLLAIIKLLLAKIIKEAGNIEKANTLYNEIISYCSEYKLATPALLSWHLIAELEMAKGNISTAMEIAQKALEISQKAGINNHLFTVIFLGQLADIQIVRSDFEAARMYVQQAIDIAKKMELYYLQTKLYLTYGKIFQEIAVVTNNNKAENATSARKLYDIAMEIAKTIDNDYIIGLVKKELDNLNNFCQISKIRI